MMLRSWSDPARSSKALLTITSRMLSFPPEVVKAFDQSVLSRPPFIPRSGGSNPELGYCILIDTTDIFLFFDDEQ